MTKLKMVFLAFLAFMVPDAALAQTTNGRATTAAPTYLNNSTAPFSLDLNGGLRTNCVTGCAGGSFNNNADAVATSATNGQAAAWLYGFNGATWDRLRAASNASDAVATSSFNLQSGAFNYGFNGATWDRLRVDGAKNLNVNVNAAIAAGGNIIGALVANQSINAAQWGGNNVLAGNGGTGTGSPRVTPASDSTGIANWGHGATGAAAPAGATQIGARNGANMAAVPVGATTTPINMSTATTTEIVPLTASQIIYVTHYFWSLGGTANVTFVTGTGSNCATGQTPLSGPIPGTAQFGGAGGGGLGPVIVVPSGQALCLTNSQAVQLSGFLTWAKYQP